MSERMRELETLAARLVEAARRLGARSADALAVADEGESVRVRAGRVESVEREDAQGVGLRAFVETGGGLAFASASTSDLSDEGLERLAAQVMAMARISAPDPDAVPPEGAEHPSREEIAAWAQSHGAGEPWPLEAAREAALACEQAALDYADAIRNSEGAEAGFGRTRVAYAASDGFEAGYEKASASLSCAVVAGQGEGMQRDYAWDRQRDAERLRAPEDIGREAARRAADRLGAASLESGAMPVIFEPRTAVSMLGHLAAAINGRAVLQHRSFLAEARGEAVFPGFVNIVDDPDHPQGLGNRLFDGEGTRCRPMRVVDAGRLTGFLTDRYAAGRLGVPPTGHARRGLTGDTGIGPSNLMLKPGELPPEAIFKALDRALLVTELIGFGVNGVTGDYSRGAAGFLIENGAIVRPVQEVTIAGNLREMFAGITHVGADVAWFGSVAAPTIAIAGMTVAGQGA